MSGVGTLAAGVLATVDEHGTVRRAGGRLSWRAHVGGEWVIPGADGRTRVSRPDAAPVVHTALRIAGGDVVARVYAVDEVGGVVVVDVENASPDAIGVAFRADGVGVCSYSRGVGATEPDGALVFPVPHRTSVRVALASGNSVDARALPDPATVVRAWDRILERGMRTELPEPLQHAVDCARADLLLASPSAATFATLEAWGFDREAVAMWDRLGIRERRAVRRVRGDGVLATTRHALVREWARDRRIELAPGFRTEWLGQSIAVHDAPLRTGRASFAVRWHGARPALLWDVPAGSTVSAPALDPAFSSTEAVGEALLAAPPATLLAMGEPAPVGGTPLAPPEQFA